MVYRGDGNWRCKINCYIAERSGNFSESLTKRKEKVGKCTEAENILMTEKKEKKTNK